MNSGAAECESLQTIIDIAVTAEEFAVTALGGALENAANGWPGLNENHILHIKAARSAEQAPFDFLTSAGAKPATTTFTVPEGESVEIAFADQGYTGEAVAMCITSSKGTTRSLLGLEWHGVHVSPVIY